MSNTFDFKDLLFTIQGKPATLTAVLLLLSSIVLLFMVSSFEFLNWDDAIHVTQNPFQSLPLRESLPYYWGEAYQGFYIPVTYSLWAILGKIAQGVHLPLSQVLHGFSLILHLCNALLLLRIIQKLFPQYPYAPLMSLLFFLHPIQIESYAWISELKGLLALFWAALAVLFTLIYGEKEKLPYLILSILFFGLSLLSKPSTIMVPLIIGLLLKRKRSYKEALLLTLPFAALSLGVAYITSQLQTADQVRYVLPLLERSVLPFHALGFYLSQIIFPFNLSPIYGHTSPTIIAAMSSQFYWILGLLFMLIVIPKKTRLFILFPLMLLPVLGIIPFSYQTFSLTADRYLYLPFAVLLVLITPLIHKSLSGRLRKFSLFCLILWCGLFCARTITYLAVWQTSETLFIHTLKFNPTIPSSYHNLFEYYYDAKDFKQANGVLALQTKNQIHTLQLSNNMMTLALAQGEYHKVPYAFAVGEATVKKVLNKSGEINNKRYANHFLLYGLYLQQVQLLYDSAAFYLSKSYALAPSDTTALHYLGQIICSDEFSPNKLELYPSNEEVLNDLSQFYRNKQSNDSAEIVSEALNKTGLRDTTLH